MSSLRNSALHRASFIAVASTVALSTARAQWNVVRLHTTGSAAFGVRNGQVVGTSDNAAAWWDVASGTYFSLASPPPPTSRALATDGVHQVGEHNSRAALWSGTDSSLIDLDPNLPGATYSIANGVSGSIQVGSAGGSTTSAARAAMWSGSAATYVDLNPPGATASAAKDVDAGQIVGIAAIQGVSHAALWTGTAASFVSLNPPGAITAICNGVHAGRQVGHVQLSGQLSHASVWSSTAASWVDLDTPATNNSWANDIAVSSTDVAHIVGQADTRACYWNDSASSWIDLHAYLPDDSLQSEATGVWLDEQSSILYVSGYRRYANNLFEAWLWWRPLQSPIAHFCFGDGSGTPCPCGNDAPLHSGGGCKNHHALSALLIAQGNPSLANDTLVLRASRLSEGTTMFFQGTMQESGGSGSVFGDGLRCASGTVVRLGSKPNPAGNAQYPEIFDPTLSARGQLFAPGTRTYQAWYRDTLSYCTLDTFNLTNGLSVTWSP